MCCTASIMHMTFISVDRYLAIRNPSVQRNKSWRTVMVKICYVWIIAMIICSPIALIARSQPHEMMPGGACVMVNKWFVVIGSSVAFFLPLLLMTSTYFLTIVILNHQAHLHQQLRETQQQAVQRNRQLQQMAIRPLTITQPPNIELQLRNAKSKLDMRRLSRKLVDFGASKHARLEPVPTLRRKSPHRELGRAVSTPGAQQGGVVYREIARRTSSCKVVAKGSMVKCEWVDSHVSSSSIKRRCK